MRPSENWRSVFLLSQSAKKKNKKSTKDSPASSPSPPPPPPQKVSLLRTQQTEIPRWRTMSKPSPETTLSVQSPVQSPDSDISPKDKGKLDYFSIEPQMKQEENKDGDAGQLSRATTLSSPASLSVESPTVDSPKVESPKIESSKESLPAESPRTELPAGRHRGSSVSSLTFAPVLNPSLPQGNQKKTDKERIRASSPPPERFQSRVAFDNLPLGDATKNNTLSLTLNVRHQGYQAQRRSRTFMVGVDENAYSDYALQWLLDELVDDGDELVCVRVIEKDVRTTENTYREEAQSVMDSILKRNTANRGISVVLEYASGKLHSTFQKLIQMYQPAMLIVGTRGRSLGGLQGLVNTRNSFSKYCLQYSPVPVVVVRPTEKRVKKKNKRQNDSERQTYIKMLSATDGKHESDCESSGKYQVEIRNTADEEAHQVAKELGLPAIFDPTIKPIDPNSFLQPRGYSLSQPSSSKAPLSTAGDSDDDEDEDEDEFETFTREQIINSNKKEKLHKMEVGEAAALLQQNRKSSLDSAGNADDDDDDEPKVSQTSSAS